MENFNIKKYKYDIDRVLDHFKLNRSAACETLNNWLNVEIPKDFKLSDLLEEKRVLLAAEGDVWNEEELKMHFLSFVFDAAKPEVSKKIKLFYERSLSGKVQNTDISVICDAMLATPLGINTPNAPYFFLQEFKKGKKAQEDAEGQMLVAMLIAQEQNGNNQPIYGCYLQGRFWYFASLWGDNYCLSGAYDATRTEELCKIVHILRSLKNIIKL